MPFLDYGRTAILLSYKLLHPFSLKELCNYAVNPMLLELKLSSISPCRSMVQMTSPQWQPPLFRTAHVINFQFNWLRLCWRIRDSGDAKWQNICTFSDEGYKWLSERIYGLLSPLEELTLWSFHNGSDY